jgi:hypothetical protein
MLNGSVKRSAMLLAADSETILVECSGDQVQHDLEYWVGADGKFLRLLSNSPRWNVA